MPKTLNPPCADNIANFLSLHRLPECYAQTIETHFSPIAEALAQRCQTKPDQSLWVAINGCQGSGKTTMAAALVMLLQQHQLQAVALSIDDFYLTRSQRQALASDIHPLLKTRGVPGTHDIALARETLDALSQSTAREFSTEYSVPHFDKAIDDRSPQSDWPRVATPVDIIILEGWCVGAQAQSMPALIEPINELEAQADHEGNWRHYVNAQLQLDYRELFERFEVNIMLKAPSFDCVYHWRLEQENKLREKTAGQGDGLMSESELLRFIQHYQRITEHNLDVLPSQVDYLLELDEQRNIFVSSR